MIAGLAGKVALVTGAESGLGSVIARHLASAGLWVFGTARNAAPAPVEGIEFLHSDMEDHAALPDLIETAAKRAGRLDLLVCNAAMQGIAPLSALSPQDWQRVMDVNLTAPFLLSQAAAPHLARTGGLTLLISSVHGVGAAPERLAYGVSKAGLIAMARGLAADLGPEGVRALALVLGPVNSPALLEGARRFFPGRSDAEVLAAFAATQPNGRIAEPEEVAELIAFLATDAARQMTGSVVTLDGGMSGRLAVPRPAD